MAQKKKKNNKPGENRYRQVAQNRRARRDYFIEEKMEAGIVLTGTEVKSLRAGHVNIQEAYANEMGGEIWLHNSYIAEYASGRDNHEPRRARKLLLHKRQIEKLVGGVQQGGMTIVPLALYFNPRGIAKIEIGLAKGKKLYDKRETDKQRDWNREKARLLREKG
ncbi:MAG: SsrA-binding protein SmpB [Alphaproteobacteria bacterium]|nr:SsrA-binding protein SmpB [Alphaproteobacteria bacterium]